MVYIVNGKAAEFSEVNQNEENVFVFFQMKKVKWKVIVCYYLS